MSFSLKGFDDLTEAASIQQKLSGGTIATSATGGFISLKNAVLAWAWRGAGAYDVPGDILNASDVRVSGDDTRSGGYEVRAKTGGLWKWLVNNVEKARLDGSGLLTDVIGELTGSAGVTVAGVLLKAGHLPDKYRWDPFEWHRDPDTLSADETEEEPIFTTKYAVTIQDATFTSSTTIAGHDMDNATITARVFDAATGALVGTLCSLTTDVASGGLVSMKGHDMGAITNGALAAGYTVAARVTKGGAGVSLKGCVLTLNPKLD